MCLSRSHQESWGRLAEEESQWQAHGETKKQEPAVREKRLEQEETETTERQAPEIRVPSVSSVSSCEMFCAGLRTAACVTPGTTVFHGQASDERRNDVLVCSFGPASPHSAAGPALVRQISSISMLARTCPALL
jgi:hypothetical protein